MTREELIDTLRILPIRLRDEEVRLMAAEFAAQEARDGLLLHEDMLRFAGVLDGKNEAIREAQLREHSQSQRRAVVVAERSVALARMEVRLTQAEFSAARAMARLMAGGDER